LKVISEKKERGGERKIEANEKQQTRKRSKHPIL